MTEQQKVGTLGTLAKIAGHGLTTRNHRLGTLGTLGTPYFFHINCEQGKIPARTREGKTPVPSVPSVPSTPLKNIIYNNIIYL